LEPGLQVAFILIVDPARSEALDASGLTLLGKLTNAESDIANHLVSGRSIQEIAQHRETSDLTVRTQVKAVAAKLRCHSQADIIRLAAITRLPMIKE
jgi:DNA-binding NarL/FixJ family response regulator